MEPWYTPWPEARRKAVAREAAAWMKRDYPDLVAQFADPGQLRRAAGLVAAFIEGADCVAQRYRYLGLAFPEVQMSDLRHSRSGAQMTPGQAPLVLLRRTPFPASTCAWTKTARDRSEELAGFRLEIKFQELLRASAKPGQVMCLDGRSAEPVENFYRAWGAHEAKHVVDIVHRFARYDRLYRQPRRFENHYTHPLETGALKVEIWGSRAMGMRNWERSSQRLLDHVRRLRRRGVELG